MNEDVVFSLGDLLFEWHLPKAERNVRKHGVTFAEGATIFRDEHALFVIDPNSAYDEKRWILFGQSKEKQLLAVVHVERGERIRLISVHPMTRHERRDYE